MLQRIHNRRIVCCVLSCPVVSSSVAHQAPLSMGILQARILVWVAMSSSRGSSRPRSPAMQADSLPSEPQGSHQGSRRIKSANIQQKIQMQTEKYVNSIHCCLN